MGGRYNTVQGRGKVNPAFIVSRITGYTITGDNGGKRQGKPGNGAGKAFTNTPKRLDYVLAP